MDVYYRYRPKNSFIPKKEMVEVGTNIVVYWEYVTEEEYYKTYEGKAELIKKRWSK